MALGLLLGVAFGDVALVSEVSSRWHSASIAESVLAAVVTASVTLAGFVVTVGILIVQTATGNVGVTLADDDGSGAVGGARRACVSPLAAPTGCCDACFERARLP